MSQDFLSQEEVDSLLKGVTDPPDRIQRIRIGHESLVKGRLPVLEEINEHFARMLRTSLTKEFSMRCEISIGAIRYQKYTQYVRNLIVPTNLNIIKSPNTGLCQLIIDPNMINSLIDHCFGGDGRFHFRKETVRDFTPLENEMVTRLNRIVLRDYSKCMSRFIKGTKFKTVGRETDPSHANSFSPGETTIVTFFTIEFQGSSHDIATILPLGAVKHHIPAFQQRSYKTEDGPSPDVDGIRVELVVHKEMCRMSVDQVSDLKVGDVIPMTGHLAELKVGDRAIATAIPQINNWKIERLL